MRYLFTLLLLLSVGLILTGALARVGSVAAAFGLSSTSLLSCGVLVLILSLAGLMRLESRRPGTA